MFGNLGQGGSAVDPSSSSTNPADGKPKFMPNLGSFMTAQPQMPQNPMGMMNMNAFGTNMMMGGGAGGMNQ